MYVSMSDMLGPIGDIEISVSFKRTMVVDYVFMLKHCTLNENHLENVQRVQFYFHKHLRLYIF